MAETRTLPRWKAPTIGNPNKKRRNQKAVQKKKYDRGRWYRKNITKEQRERIFDRDGRLCLSCSSPQNLTIDHIVPIAAGGRNIDSNLQTLCTSCNNAKGDSAS